MMKKVQNTQNYNTVNTNYKILKNTIQYICTVMDVKCVVVCLGVCGCKVFIVFGSV